MKRRSCYWVVDVPGGWGVACVVEGERGYHPVEEYGPYTIEAHAQGVVDRLNARMGIDPVRARRIVASTMPRAS